jgi:chemotaxis protein CheD
MLEASLKLMRCGDDDLLMRLAHIDDRHRELLTGIAERSAGRAAANLSALAGVPVDVSRVGINVAALDETIDVAASLASSTVLVVVGVSGDVEAALVLAVPPVVEHGMLALLGVERGDDAMRVSAMGEIGNIIGGGIVQEFASSSQLDLMLDPPQVGAAGWKACERAIHRSASKDDAIVGISAFLQPRDVAIPPGQIEALLIPAPGTLQRLMSHLAPAADAPTRRETAVAMGELAVASHPGDVLVARGLGSCVGLVLIDRVARVAALAHVMLPKAPSRRSLGGRPTYSARYADTAVPALVDALQNAGGSAHRAHAYMAGGSQMFRELQASDQLRISARNVEILTAELAGAQIPVRAADLGGDSGRLLEVAISPMSVVCHVPAEGRIRSLLDAA